NPTLLNIKSDGRQRVIISNISPQIDGGKFAAKTVLNEPITISADIFSDGHDEVKAAVLVRHENERQWKELPMELIVNDRWEAVFTPDKLGYYQFKVQGWIDHFTTWKKGLKKKHEASQNVDVELLIGSEILEKAAKTADSKDKKQLLQLSQELRNESVNGSRVSQALGNDLSALVARAGDR